MRREEPTRESERESVYLGGSALKLVGIKVIQEEK